MYQRLTLARDLLTPDGVILVSINDENRARLELLMDEVFPGRRIGSLTWKKRRTSNAAGVENFFSSDHEHVLVFGEESFSFAGSGKNWDKYDQWDDVANDWWASTQLTLGFNKQQRRNLFYPLHNPKTDIWYPCNPNRVWARATEKNLKGKEVRTESMEVLIARDGVHFPDERSPAIYGSVDEIESAFAAGSAPPHLQAQDDFAFWIGKQIGFFKPRFKTYKSKVRSESQPLSSWIAETGKPVKDEDAFAIEAGLTSEGTRAIRTLDLGDDFPYPKPLSLIKSRLDQTMRPHDIALDFFAGSGTTGQAVMELNADDDGQRRYILCSSTEATSKEPDKNICRDVCAERMRRVSAGYAGKSGFSAEHGGEFAYLQLDCVAPADIPFEASATQAYPLLSLRLTRTIQSFTDAPVQMVARAGDCDILLCTQVDAASINTLAEWAQTHGVARIAVYSERPESLDEALTARGIDAVCYGLYDALRHGQAGGAR